MNDSKWKLKHIKELNKNYFEELKKIYPDRILSCKDILTGLNILNNGDFPSIMLIDSNTSANKFVCFNCDDDKFNSVFRHFECISNEYNTLRKQSQINIERLKTN